MSENQAGQAMLAGMPGPWELWLGKTGTQVAVGRGPVVLFSFEEDDRAMRNLAMVALSGAPAVTGKQVAECFGVSAEHLSRLRTRVAEGGAAALCPPQGRPAKLSEEQRQAAWEMADQGTQGLDIARAFGVSPATISRLLSKRRRPAPPGLPIDEEVGAEEAGVEEAGGQSEPEPTGDGGTDQAPEQGEATEEEEREEQEGAGAGLARLGEAEVTSRYGGAMLLHPFLDRLSATDILASLPDAGEGAHYDAISLVLSATFAFSLGSSSMEGTKHLARRDAGALVGLSSFPELRTMRPRLAGIAEAIDPLALQRSFASAMLDADSSPTRLFFCDDHFVAYTGGKPVGKGYNIRRHRCEPGRDDTLVTDGDWRAICFSSGEPSGLSVTLPSILGQLVQVCQGRRVMVGFDRGGSYPKVFSALRQVNMDWVSYRRAPLVAPTASPRWSWTTMEGRRVTTKVSDEVVDLDGYGSARQLSVYEGAKVAFQILTSDLATPAATLVRTLRRRWSIENSFKYLEDHHGIHWLCDYQMDVVPDPRKVDNPARSQARARVKEARDALGQAERALAQNLTDSSITPTQANAASVGLRRGVDAARADLEAAEAALKGIPAKVGATELDPDAKRARPHLARRSLQMVCRLLAYNAELDLARRLNTYLDDPDEYRAITRNLLHLAGVISYGPEVITVTLDRPHPPRLARALGLLLEEINATPPRLTGDGRSITYRLEGDRD